MTHKVRVSATEVGDVVFCPYRLANKLQRRSVTRQSVRLAGRGDRAHARENRKGRASPCFISTAIYGPEHECTDALRFFRDEFLMRSMCGRWFVYLYYRVSPWFVPVLKRSAVLRKGVMWLLHRLFFSF